MTTAPDAVLPAWDESDRIAALRTYGILDTAPEKPFDDLVALAARVCEAPMAVISLVDGRRQWFKAEIGLGVSETPLSTSFCALAMAENDGLVVLDAQRDPRFDCNPLVTGEPHIRRWGPWPCWTRSPAKKA